MGVTPTTTRCLDIYSIYNLISTQYTASTISIISTHQAKFNITVPLPHDKADRHAHLLSSSSVSLHDNRWQSLMNNIYV